MPLRPRPTARRARHVLAWLACAWLAGQLAVGLALDAAPTWVRFRQGGKVLRAAASFGDEPYVALLGSSRFRDVDLGALSDALGEATGAPPPLILQGAVLAGDPVVFDYLLERLLGQGTVPTLAILELSPETLSYPAHWVADHVTRMFTWRDLPAWIGEIAARGQLGDLATKRLMPIHVYRTELLGWLTLERAPYLRVPSPQDTPDGEALEARRPRERRRAHAARSLPLGAHPLVRPTAGEAPDIDARTLSGLRRMRDWLEDYRTGGGAVRSLESALARCREAGVRVVLVGVPVTSAHRELYTPEILAAYQAVLAPLLERTGVSYREYRARVPDALFVDNHHLSAEGGAFFGRMLAREVIAPAWTRARD
jgi:hypothetical protein